MTYLGNDPIGIVQALKISEIDDTAGAGDTNKTWSADKLVTEIPDVQINSISIVNQGVANIPVAGNDYGVAKISQNLGVNISNGYLCTSIPDSTMIKAGTNTYKPVVPSNQHESVFYGLAKAAGDSTQSSSSNAVGTYTVDAKAAIQSMLGVPGDVQVNGTSILQNGVANVPIASASNLGVVKTSTNLGTFIQDGIVGLSKASSENIKNGAHQCKVIVPYNQHESIFYGLSKVAGVDLASQTVTPGTYPANAKAAIQSMLGVESGISLVETVIGTTPTITGQPNVKYVCGEVSTLSITPPANGTIDVIFTSGSTATVLTVPNTVKFPSWFDATSLDADTIYEIMITDGVYGSVMTWVS